MVNANEEYYLLQLQNMLIWKTYTVNPTDYKMFTKIDKGKVREIYKLDYFPHRILQHALLNVIEDILLKSFIDNTFSSIPNRGIHLALKRMSRDIQNDKEGTEYCLKMDVQKFYPSINQEINKKMYRFKFKDNDLLWLIDLLVDSMDGETGIAIGSLFSQWAGNLHMSPFDHWIKEIKGVKYYYRYCDDLVILHHNKKFLKELMVDIEDYLCINLKLKIKDDKQIFPTRIRGVDFIGYRHFGDYILLRKTTALNMKRKLRRILIKCEKGCLINHSEYCCINSYKGWIKWCDGHNLYKKYIKPLEPHIKKYYEEVIRSGKKN